MRVEKAIRDQVCADAKKAGWVVRILGWKGKRGAPDMFFAKAGRVVLIEFKSPGEKPRPDQMEEHDILRAAGVETHVCDSILFALKALGVAA